MVGGICGDETLELGEQPDIANNSGALLRLRHSFPVITMSSSKAASNRAVSHEEYVFRYQSKVLIHKTVRPPMCIASFAIPMIFVYKSVVVLAGTTTTINTTLGLTVSIGATLACTPAVIGFFANRGKLKRQGEELDRLRERCTELEQKNQRLREANAKLKK